MDVAIVILNWNGGKMLRRYLPSVVRTASAFGGGGSGDSAFVVVADNGSTDDSLAILKNEFPQVRTIRFFRNWGFTGGYNRALQQVDADYYIILNDDVAVEDGWIEPLFEFMEENPEAGACQPKMLADTDRTSFEYAGACGGFIDRFGYPFCRGRILSNLEKDNGQYDEPMETFWATGACMMIRSSLFHHLGGFDDRFFAHMEEIDLCWRTQLSGYKVTVVPQSMVWHLGGGTLSPDSPFKLQLNYRNNLLMMRNNLPATIGRCRASARIFFRMCLDGGSALVYLLGGKKEFFKAVVTAHRQYRKLVKEKTVATARRGCKPEGYLDSVCIIAASAVFGQGIFEHLRKYENHN